MARVLWQVQRSGDSGSPRVSASIIASSLSTRPGSVTSMGLRPAPGRRMRPPHDTPASISPMPLWMALRDSPHARCTRLTPPWPNALASLAAVRRRVRSSSRGQTVPNFAFSSARVFTFHQHNAEWTLFIVTITIPLFIYNSLALRCLHSPPPNSVAHLLPSGPATALTYEDIRAVEIHKSIRPSPMTVSARIYGGQAVGRKTDSTQVTHHRSRSASTGSLERRLFRTSAQGVFPCLHALSK